MTGPLRAGDSIAGYDVNTTRTKTGVVVEVLDPVEEREECRAVIEDKRGKRSTVSWPMVGPWTRSPGT